MTGVVTVMNGVLKFPVSAAPRYPFRIYCTVLGMELLGGTCYSPSGLSLPPLMVSRVLDIYL